jgi:hypothetical protein
MLGWRHAGLQRLTVMRRGMAMSRRDCTGAYACQMQQRQSWALMGIRCVMMA